MLGVPALTSRSQRPSLKEEATLSRQLRTPQFLVTHVPVGYRGQYRESCHSECMTVTAATSCRTRTAQLSSPAAALGVDPRETVMAAGSAGATVRCRSGLKLRTRNARLPNNRPQRAESDLLVIRYRHGGSPAIGGPLHDDVAAALSNLREPVALEDRTYLLARQHTQFTQRLPPPGSRRHRQPSAARSR
jgi:hypothetical protein